MANQASKKKSQVQADNSSVATGDVSIGGGVTGDFHIGNSYGLSTEETTRLFDEVLSKVERKDFTGECPYKGLDFFEESDAELFFGREKLVDELLSRVKTSRTVFITGASGSGKSSLVRAGLIPALKKGGIKTSKSNEWAYSSMKPGREPFKALAASLSRIKMEVGDYFEKNVNAPEILHKCAEALLSESTNQRFVLFIDQFEEVFTQISTEEERNSFLKLLTNAAVMDGGRVIILFTMRSDFVPNCARYPNLNDLLNQQFIQIGAMQPEELIRAISLPALHVGLDIKPDLVAHIINEMNGEPGALPLMQFALKDLFDALQEKGNLKSLSLEAYLERGGIHKALERHADKTFASLSESEQNLTRSIFSGLIEIGRNSQDTKRTAHFEELISAEADRTAVDAILQKLASARLVTLDSAGDYVTVTLSHEKLLSAWTWLRKLVDENRDVIAVQNEIINDAREWDENKRDDSFLYRGARLANAREKLDAKKLALNGLGMEFVKAGEKAYMDALEREKKRAEHLQKITNDAVARQLTMQAQSIVALLESKRLVSFLLAVQSIKLSPTREAAQLLLESDVFVRPFISILGDFEGGWKSGIINFSPDGKHIFFRSQNKIAQVWDALTGKELAHLSYDEPTHSMDFSQDGKYIATGSWNSDKFDGDSYLIVSDNRDKLAHIWEASTGKELRTLSHDDTVICAAFSPDGKYIASGSRDKTARVWEVSTGKEISRIIHSTEKYRSYNDRSEEVHAVAFSPNSEYVVSQSTDQSIIWKAQTGKTIAKLPIEHFHDFTFFGDGGKYLIVCNKENVRVWEFATGKIIAQLNFTDARFVFSQNGRYLAACEQKSTVVYEVGTQSKIASITHDKRLECECLSEDGKYLVVSSFGEIVARVLEVATNTETARMTHNSYIKSAAFSPDGQHVVSTSSETLYVWPTTMGQSRMVQKRIIDDTRPDNISPDGQFVKQYLDKTAKVLSVSSGAEVISITYNKSPETIVFSPDGNYVVSTGCEREINIGGRYDVTLVCSESSVRIWSLSSRKELARIQSKGDVRLVVFSPDSKYMLFDDDDSAHLWDITTLKELAQLPSPQSDDAIALSLDSNSIFIGHMDQKIRFWEAKTGKMVAEFWHGGRISLIALSLDGNLLASAGEPDTPVRVWEIATGQEITHLAHNAYVDKLAFSSDGKLLVSAGSDNTARIWEVKTGMEIAYMNRDCAWKSVAFSPDGKYVILQGSDKVEYCWLFQPKDLINAVDAVIPRNLTRAEWNQYIGNALPYQAICENLPIEEESA